MNLKALFFDQVILMMIAIIVIQLGIVQVHNIQLFFIFNIGYWFRAFTKGELTGS